MSTRVICILLLLVSPLLASGAILETSASIPESPNNWNETLQIEAFDPNVGDLIAVHFSVEGRFAGEFRHENLAEQLAGYSDEMLWTLQVSMDLTARSGDLIAFDDSVQVNGDLLPFDGEDDFAGRSGVTLSLYTPVTGGIVIAAPYCDDFYGTGTLDVHLVSTSAAQLSMTGGGGVSVSSSSCAAEVTVIYEFVPTAVFAEQAAWGDVKNLYR